MKECGGMSNVFSAMVVNARTGNLDNLLKSRSAKASTYAKMNIIHVVDLDYKSLFKEIKITL